MKKFKFSRELRDQATVGMVKDHVARITVLAEEAQSIQLRIEREQREFTERICSVLQFPRTLTPVIDFNHAAEHDVVYLTSQEVADAVEEKPKETLH